MIEGEATLGASGSGSDGRAADAVSGATSWAGADAASGATAAAHADAVSGATHRADGAAEPASSADAVSSCSLSADYLARAAAKLEPGPLMRVVEPHGSVPAEAPQGCAPAGESGAVDAATGATPGVASACRDLGMSSVSDVTRALGIKAPGER